MSLEDDSLIRPMTNPEDHIFNPEIQSISADPNSLLHFVGIAGAGMSALADYRLQAGGRVSGSDRFFDQGNMGQEMDRLKNAGATILPQDGRGLDNVDLVVASTAVEAQIPDLVRAKELGIPMAHRAELLAAHVASRPTIAIAGTSGKSTVVGMTFAALRGAGLDPGTITGGELNQLRSESWRGNGYHGTGPLVVEADESDKSLIRYAPQVAVVLNLHKDHDEVDAIRPVFRQFCSQSTDRIVVSEDANLRGLRPEALVFGLGEESSFRATAYTADRNGCTFKVEGVQVRVPMPGKHNMLNALAAMAVAKTLDCDLKVAAQGLALFSGVSRRFDVLGTKNGIEVIDDFAHNPAKIEAAMVAAKSRGKRLFAIFQPHGFAPTKFMRHDYVRAAQSALGPNDRLCLLEIFYAGGTVTKDISAADLCRDMEAAQVQADFFLHRTDLIAELARATVTGDTILLMGARDPSLGAFAQDVFAAIGTDYDQCAKT